MLIACVRIHYVRVQIASATNEENEENRLRYILE